VTNGRAFTALVGSLGSYQAVRHFVAAVIQRLSLDNFYQTVQLTYDIADEYGIYVDSSGWYIKLCIDSSDPEVSIISFHPPERPMKTKAGMVNPP
jgi:hypothetical protein